MAGIFISKGVKRSPRRSGRARRSPRRRWELSDHDWRGVERVLDRLDPVAATGRPRIDRRRALNGILYRTRTGCRWRDIPAQYGDDATLHRTFRKWLQLGVFDKIGNILPGLS
jgi:transposase